MFLDAPFAPLQGTFCTFIGPVPFAFCTWGVIFPFDWEIRILASTVSARCDFETFPVSEIRGAIFFGFIFCGRLLFLAWIFSSHFCSTRGGDYFALDGQRAAPISCQISHDGEIPPAGGKAIPVKLYPWYIRSHPTTGRFRLLVILALRIWCADGVSPGATACWGVLEKLLDGDVDSLIPPTRAQNFLNDVVV